MDTGVSAMPGNESYLVSQLQQTTGAMSTWLKFLGVITIVSGALSVISIVGIIFAWLPIWMGVLLFQAGDRARSYAMSNDLTLLVPMLQKLRLYFMISGVVTIIVLAFSILAVVFMGAFMEQFSTQFQEMMMQY